MATKQKHTLCQTKNTKTYYVLKDKEVLNHLDNGESILKLVAEFGI